MNKFFGVSVVAFLIASYYTQSGGKSRQGRIVATKTGNVQGIISKSRDGRDFEEWRGIPYAEPPVGELRFASPVPVKPWSGVRDGSKYGSKCAQTMGMAGLRLTLGHEDCLFLNVYAPKLEHKDLKKLPVMVWFHGGAFAIGASTDLLPDYLMDEDIVLVSLNYRLGVFGFICPGDGSIDGNMGLKDQALALKWVRDNIEAFGGDSNRITIFGNSAGGASVHYQTLSSKTQGLFHKAIIQSGVAGHPWTIHSPSNARKMAKKFAKYVGCDPEGLSGVDVASCLRAKSTSDLLEAQVKEMEKLYAFLPHKDGQHFRPCVEPGQEGAFITEHPLDIVAGGRAHRMPVMVGATSDEGLPITMVLLNSEDALIEFEANWTVHMARQVGLPENTKRATEITDKIRERYVQNWEKLSRGDRIAGYVKMFTDTHITFHMHHVIAEQRQFSPVFAYYYSRRGGPPAESIILACGLFGRWPLLDVPSFGLKMIAINVFGMKHPDFGVAHGDELPMLGPTPLSAVWKNDQDPNYLFSKELVKLWVDFASTNESTLEFQGTKFRPTRQSGSIEYFQITDDSAGIISAPFEDHAEFLKSLGLLRPELL